MKKILSVLLAFAMAMSLMVAASAKTPMLPPAPLLPGRKAPAAFTQGLGFELPDVTGLTAAWIGGSVPLWPEDPFTPETVAVTASFAAGQGAPETLSHWWDSGNGWWWNVFCEYDDAIDKFVFYYYDSDLAETYGNLEWADILPLLPQAAITLPAGFLEQYLNPQAPPLELDAGRAAAPGLDDFVAFPFTPAQDGDYTFYSFENGGDPYGYLLGPNLDYMDSNDDGAGNGNFRMTAQLKGGVTYYLIASSYASEGASYKVMVTQGQGPSQFGSGAFKLRMEEYPVSYLTWEYLDLDWFIEENGYEDALVNGVPLLEFTEDYWYGGYYSYIQIFAEGNKPGKLMTLTFTTADGQTVLGEADVVCKLSALQWICYILLFGWAWMPYLDFVPAAGLPRYEYLKGDLGRYLLNLLLALWYGR